MTTTDPVNDLLLSGGVTTAKFPNIGDVVKGVIVAKDANQQTDYATGEPKTYSDGKPMMQVVVTLQTDERDPSIDDDDGLRKLYVKGQMMTAVRDALRTAKTTLDIGGTLAVQYASDKPSEKRGFNAQKIYVAQYKPPADTTNDLLGATDTATAAPVTTSDLI